MPQRIRKPLKQLARFRRNHQTNSHPIAAKRTTGTMIFHTVRIALALAVALASAPLAAAPADELRGLLDRGQSAEAYAAGARQPEEFGKPDFDFYFGIAAIDTGHAGEGILALERFLTARPGYVPARLHLGRGLYAIGEDARARDVFSGVRDDAAASGEEKVAAERYLDAIRAREARTQGMAAAWIEAGLGYDSNVNSGIKDANVSLPLLGSVTVTPAAVRESDSFGHFGLGGRASRPIASGVSLFGQAQLEAKGHFNDDEYDQTSTTLSGGLSWIRGVNTFRAAYTHNIFTLDGSRYRTANMLSGDWQRQYGATFAGLTVFGGRLDYEGANAVRDAKFYGVMGSWRRTLASRLQPVVFADLTLGREEADASGRGDLSRDTVGLRAGVALSPAPRWGVSAGARFQDARHQGREPLMGRTRHDRYYAADLTVSYALSNNLSLRGELLFSRNDSNIALYEYSRNTGLLKLRYDFK
jgi:hypothetical protein